MPALGKTGKLLYALFNVGMNVVLDQIYLL